MRRRDFLDEKNVKISQIIRILDACYKRLEVIYQEHEDWQTKDTDVNGMDYSDEWNNVIKDLDNGCGYMDEARAYLLHWQAEKDRVKIWDKYWEST